MILALPPCPSRVHLSATPCLVGPGGRNLSWRAKAAGASNLDDFAIDWDRQVARCPEGAESVSWAKSIKHRGQRPTIRVQFRAADCRACTSRHRCTRIHSRYVGRVLALLPRREHKAPTAARMREATQKGRRLYGQRQGIEGTISQAVRAFGLCRARYRGLAKARLQHIATTAALNLDRLAAWLAERSLAPTRLSRFAAVVA